MPKEDQEDQQAQVDEWLRLVHEGPCCADQGACPTNEKEVEAFQESLKIKKE